LQQDTISTKKLGISEPAFRCGESCFRALPSRLPPSSRRDCRPHRFHQPERPSSLQESVDRSQHARKRECQDEPRAPLFERIERDHQSDSDKSEGGQRVHHDPSIYTGMRIGLQKSKIPTLVPKMRQGWGTHSCWNRRASLDRTAEGGCPYITTRPLLLFPGPLSSPLLSPGTASARH
jgi:hypothetical protein